MSLVHSLILKLLIGSMKKCQNNFITVSFLKHLHKWFNNIYTILFFFFTEIIMNGYLAYFLPLNSQYPFSCFVNISSIPSTVDKTLSINVPFLTVSSIKSVIFYTWEYFISCPKNSIEVIDFRQQNNIFMSESFHVQSLSHHYRLVRG